MQRASVIPFSSLQSSLHHVPEAKFWPLAAPHKNLNTYIHRACKPVSPICLGHLSLIRSIDADSTSPCEAWEENAMQCHKFCNLAGASKPLAAESTAPPMHMIRAASICLPCNDCPGHSKRFLSCIECCCKTRISNAQTWCACGQVLPALHAGICAACHQSPGALLSQSPKLLQKKASPAIARQLHLINVTCHSTQDLSKPFQAPVGCPCRH